MSKDAPNFANRTVWTGDNLDILRGINSECVDLIYLDPPFNSNQDYAAPIGSKAAGAAFKDTWTLDDVDEAWHGEIAERDSGLYSVIAGAGLAHGSGMKSYLIMMAVRLLEMHRVLKPTGSIYLHCDDTAVHYLKMLLDSVFGARRYRNDIVWQRTSSRNDAGRWGRVHDALLFYTRSDAFTWNRVMQEHDPEYIRKAYRYEDEEGRYRLHEIIRTASMGERPNLTYEYKGYRPRWGWRKIREKVEALDEAGYLVWSDSGRPYVKRYLHDHPGVPIRDVITDIPPATGKTERTGYPTQKPLALLERIIAASSKPDDVVLDPFCGCATTLVAAETLGRKWAGIDLSPLAVKLVAERLSDHHGMFGQVAARTDIPRRNDLGKLPNYRTYRHTLYGRQEGNCMGCRIHFPFRNLTVDHIVPQSKGGSDHLDNLQLLCGACNSKKGNRPMEALIAELFMEGIRQ
ncbi:MAG: hypothetical protein F4Z31_04555 [Gemmatimonadetes bacterium]|nr:hypothetical protein [Gemmatimonadota bacterium]MYE95515.1 hypothetical protein [Gemmatimonadota bacterium]MYJ12430.1 hypothetical protein [Gemmatimonadota bacterium]